MVVISDTIMYLIDSLLYRVGFLKSEYGGERLRPDDGKSGRMSRTPVGLVNLPATNLNWQLSVANGCLI